MEFKGIQKITLIDFPGHIASTLFLSKCNFSCPYCQNPLLVRDDKSLQSIPEKEMIELLNDRKEFIEGICITGGEPTLYGKELKEFIKKIKRELKLKVKLDTNGSNPKILKELIEERLLDYIAMDIKGPIEKYEEIARAKVDRKAVQESIDLIMNSGLEYEFRTTIVPEFFSKEDAIAIGKWLMGAKKYFLQQFNNQTELLDPKFKEKKPYPPEKLKELAQLMKPFFGECGVRGI